VNAVDIVVVVVLLASGVFALMRGFVHEVLAMAGWIIAPLAAVQALPYVRPLAHQYISPNPTIADGAGGFAVFLVVLLLLSLVTHAISKKVQGSAVSSVDRSLGFAFGLLRGLVLVSLAYMVAKTLMPDDPEILANAKTRPLMVIGATMIQSLVPEQVSEAQSKVNKAAGIATEAKQASDAYSGLLAPKPRSPDQPKDEKHSPAYDNSSLERLIENTK